MSAWSGTGMGTGTGALEIEAQGGSEVVPTAPDGLQIRCFGHFEVIRHGKTVHDWRRDKARTLLKHLIANRGSMHRDVLLDLLWPERETDAAVRNLRVTLHALRRSLDGEASRGPSVPYVLTSGDTYKLNPEVLVWVDAHAFSALYEAAGHLRRHARPDESVRTYEAAQSLYRDDYLVDDLYEEWTFVQRELLKDQFLLVLTRLAEAAATRHDFEGCMAYCHKILSKDASREDAYQHLMRCHARMGHRARALRWYELCCEMLRSDLNVEPSDSTLHLAQRIAAGHDIDSPEAVSAAAGRAGFDQRVAKARVA